MIAWFDALDYFSRFGSHGMTRRLDASSARGRLEDRSLDAANMTDLRSSSLITLHRSFERCQHGKEIRDVSAKPAGDGWLIWGHYQCMRCGWVAIDHVKREHAPSIALVGGQKLPILVTT